MILEISISLESHSSYLWHQIGTDIEDFKCSWLVAKALELCNEQQKKVLYVSDHLNISLIFCYD